MTGPLSLLSRAPKSPPATQEFEFKREIGFIIASRTAPLGTTDAPTKPMLVAMRASNVTFLPDDPDDSASTDIAARIPSIVMHTIKGVHGSVIIVPRKPRRRAPTCHSFTAALVSEARSDGPSTSITDPEPPNSDDDGPPADLAASSAQAPGPQSPSNCPECSPQEPPCARRIVSCPPAPSLEKLDVMGDDDEYEEDPLNLYRKLYGNFFPRKPVQPNLPPHLLKIVQSNPRFKVDPYTGRIYYTDPATGESHKLPRNFGRNNTPQFLRDIHDAIWTLGLKPRLLALRDVIRLRWPGPFAKYKNMPRRRKPLPPLPKYQIRAKYQSAAVWAADVHPMMRTRARPRTDLPPLEPPITLVVREPPALWAPVAPEIGPDGEELTKLPPVVQVCVNFPCWQALMKLQRDYSHVEV